MDSLNVLTEPAGALDKFGEGFLGTRYELKRIYGAPPRNPFELKRIWRTWTWIMWEYSTLMIGRQKRSGPKFVVHPTEMSLLRQVNCLSIMPAFCEIEVEWVLSQKRNYLF